MVGRLLANAWLIAFCGLVLLLALLLPIPALGAPDPPDHFCLTDDSMDDDGDGILDADDPAPCQAGAVPTPAETTDSPNHDSDGDGLTNDADPDDDNDGTEDAADPAPFDPTKPGNVQPTEQTDSENADHDGDGLSNADDPDDDNDGVQDADDPAPFDSARPGAVTPTPATDSEGVDSDGDGLPNAADPDDDNDGVQDADDYAPFDPNVSIALPPTQAPRASRGANDGGAAPQAPTGEPVFVRDLPSTARMPNNSPSGAVVVSVVRGSEEPVTTLPTTGQRHAVGAGIAGPFALILLALTCGIAARTLRRKPT